MVCNKLETGFDEPRLSVLYLDRWEMSDSRLTHLLGGISRAT